MEKYQTTIINAIADLPENIQNAIKNFNWSDEVLAIARKYRLQIDEISSFQEETMLVIVGLSSAKRYKEKLIENMNISEELASELVLEANNRIFKELQKRAFTKEASKNTNLSPLTTDSHNEHHDHAQYQEQISEDDLKGIGGHRINTVILKERNQINPSIMLEKNYSPANDEQKRNDLEQKILNEKYISKGDTLEAEKPYTQREQFLKDLKSIE